MIHKKPNIPKILGVLKSFFNRIGNSFESFQKSITYYQDGTTKQWVAEVEYCGHIFVSKAKRKKWAFMQICIEFEKIFNFEINTNRICRWPRNSW